VIGPAADHVVRVVVADLAVDKTDQKHLPARRVLDFNVFDPASPCLVELDASA